MIRYLFFLLVLLASTGCMTSPKPVADKPVTVIPALVPARKPTIDSSTPKDYPQEANSGLLYLIPGKGAVLTKNAVDRYNTLVKAYGADVTDPDLKVGEGYTEFSDEHGNPLYLMDEQHLVLFQVMATWKRSGRAPNSVITQLKNKL